MYPGYSYPFYYPPYGQTPYIQSYGQTPYIQSMSYDFDDYDFNDDYDDLDGRQFGQMFPSGPPMGPPPSLPGSQGPGQGSQSGPPTAPPPSYVPAQQATAFAVDPGSIRGCLFRYTYVWLNNRQQFWFYPTFVGRTSVSGWRWNGFMWMFFGISLRQIQSFTCV